MYLWEERTRIGDLRCRRGFKAGSTNWGVIHPWIAVKTTGVDRTTQKEEVEYNGRGWVAGLQRIQTFKGYIEEMNQKEGVFIAQ